MATRRPSATDPPAPEVLEFADHVAWEAWLREHHADRSGVWLRIAKKSAPVRTVAYPEVLDVAICHGWIDGQRKSLDEIFFLQRFTRRAPRSRWSQVNREKALALIEAGRMHPAGRAEVEAAQADGRWAAAYEPQSRASVPEDLQRALDENPRAAEFFASLTGARRYAFLYRLHNVRTPERRAQRIAEYIARLSEGRTLS
ncbi:MAG TPA: YdeI/OmpD-associated family protein [Solirubrobacteraceae bacterium]